jgi:hypothetical protein
MGQPAEFLQVGPGTVRRQSYGQVIAGPGSRIPSVRPVRPWRSRASAPRRQAYVSNHGSRPSTHSSRIEIHKPRFLGTPVGPRVLGVVPRLQGGQSLAPQDCPTPRRR